MTPDAIRFLAEKGLSALEIAEFAEMVQKPTRTPNAERQARFRERRLAARAEAESVTCNVTSNAESNVTSPALSPPQ